MDALTQGKRPFKHAAQPPYNWGTKPGVDGGHKALCPPSLLPDEEEYQTVEDLLWGSFKLTTLAVTPVPQSQVEQHGQIATGDVIIITD